MAIQRGEPIIKNLFLFEKILELLEFQRLLSLSRTNQPFAEGAAPLAVKAKGRRIPSWTIDETDLTGVLPSARAARSETVEDIILVPMGAQRLRISAFPTSGE